MSASTRKILQTYKPLVADALREIDDCFALRHSPLCHLPTIQELARKRYSTSLLARAKALQIVLRQCCESVSLEAKDPLKTFIQMYAKGERIATIARELNRTREHCSAVYRKQAIELVTEEFLNYLEILRPPHVAKTGNS